MKVSKSESEPVAAGDVLAELDRVLKGPSFRSSKRSQQFLNYAVQQVLAGLHENLKERTIGVAVFDRPATYDTSEDATVRVAAGEVRKRLTQFYTDAQAHALRIELPLGSYVPEFVTVHSTAVVEAEPSTPVVHSGTVEANVDGSAPPPQAVPAGTNRLWVAMGAVVLLSALALARFTTRSAFDDFWEPMIASRQPVVICLTHPVVFLLSERVQKEYVERHKIDQFAGPYVVRVDPKDLRPDDLVPATDQYVGSGDAYASSQFMAFLKARGGPAELRLGQDLTFADLRSRPAILIGAYSNRWAMQSNSEYRFSFGHFSVKDRVTGKDWTLTDMTPDYKSKEDYAIVSRVFQSYTGQLVILSAGITNAGTHAAAEFLTNPRYLNAALARLPRGWRKRNLQFVLHCRVINNVPGPPEVVAFEVW